MHPIVMNEPDCHVMPPAPNASNSLTFILRLCTLGLALASAIVMATASECTIDGEDDDGAATTTVSYKDFPPFVYLVACNITATILEMAALYLQAVKGNDDDEDAPVLPRVVRVVLDVAVQVLLYSSAGGAFAAVTAYGDQINACTGNFCEQLRRAKLLGLGAGLGAGLAAVVKDVPLPFSIWPILSD